MVEMPRTPYVSYRYNIRARHEPYGNFETIEGTVAKHLRKVGATKQQKIPQYKPVRTGADATYLVQCVAETKAHILRLENLAKLQEEYDRLQQLQQYQEIQQSISSEPLINRISPQSTTEDKYFEMPKGIKFRKEKIIKRESEYQNLINATSTRLGDFLRKTLDKEVLDDHAKGVEKLFDNWDKFIETFKDNANRYTNKSWRLIKKDCQAVKHIPMHKIDERWDEICKELAALSSEKRGLG
jgi:hypothetical protein